MANKNDYYEYHESKEELRRGEIACSDVEIHVYCENCDYWFDTDRSVDYECPRCKTIFDYEDK